MYSRADLAALRQTAKERERTDGRWLAAVSVGLGLGQLLVMRWAERAFARGTALAIEGVVFVVYLALVAWLLRRRVRHQNAAAIRCPGCGVRLDDLSLRIATASAHCDRCGARVLSD